MRMRYLGKTGLYEGKFFIHGWKYDLTYAGTDYRGWLWYNIEGVLIPYTEKGFQEIWKSL